MLVLGLLLAMATMASAADLALKATWTPNTDTVTTGYRLYRTDGARVLVGTIPGKTTALYNFTITVPDNSLGTLKFVLTAYSPTKESADSVTASYPFDLTPVPAVPSGVNVVVQ